MAGNTVLVVEDDSAIRRGLVDALTFAGFRPVECGDGPSAVVLADEMEVDLVLLDVMLPEMNGFDVLAELRRSRPTLPVIMVTARGAEDDRVRGLTGGADDYVVKPFSAREVIARVQAVMRRSAERRSDVAVLRIGQRVVDLEKLEIRHTDGTSHTISEREAAILRYLAVADGRVVHRDELLQRVWGLDPMGIRTRTVDMQIMRIREKIEDDPANPCSLLTVRGKGYRLAETVLPEALP